MSRLQILAGTAALCCAIAGCGGSNETTFGNGSSYGGNTMTPQAQQQVVTTATTALQDKNAIAVTTGVDQFGFNLFAGMAKAQPDENVCISPIGVGSALAMLYNGAAGDTQKQIGKALQVGKLTVDQINAANKNLGALLNNIDPKQVDLRVANSIWADSSAPISPDYVQKDLDNYSAKVTTLDFKAPAAPSTINDWVKDTTHGKIPTIIDQVPSNAELYVINAVYFNGTWQRPFDKLKTVNQPFTLADTTTEQVPMMNQVGSFGYFTNADATGVVLPYGSGRLEMDILLPGAKLDIAGLSKKLTAALWETWVKTIKPTQIQVEVPTFQSQFVETLNNQLKDIGLSDAFDSTKADFSAMLTKGAAAPATKLYLSDVKHKTFISFDEQGTQAAAATSGQITATAIMASPTKFVADHPFLYMIRDNTTGAILFEGVVVDPKMATSDGDAPIKDKKKDKQSSTTQASNQGTATPPSTVGK